MKIKQTQKDKIIGAIIDRLCFLENEVKQMTKENEQMKDKDLAKLELMDWKQIEREAIQALRSANTTIAISKILYTNAVKKIKEMGGLTTLEEDKKAKKLRENQTAPDQPDDTKPTK